ncbi:MAG: glutaminyl-peptide cyclotransferase [Cryomorphaceae bacterium]|nr:glutaminyl-peptide cyclotransferase [Cryomorphaceae bacterium]
MTNMKRYVIIGAIVAIVLAMVLGPIFSGNTNSAEEDVVPAMFSFKENLATKWGDQVELSILIQKSGIEKLELIYNDSVFKTWNNPSGTLTYLFNAAYYGLGARNVRLLSTMKNGDTYVDERIVRVVSDVVPEVLNAQIVESYPHNATSFTQGLEFDGEQLYEGTGQRGQSMVAQVDLKSGRILKKMGLDATCFGEGITVLGDEVFQLTWQEQRCFVYDKKTLQLKREMSYIGEGWGLCNDGSSLIMSDGSERITFRDPKTFEIQRTIEVYTHQGAVANLNELEYADDLIYANVWMTNKIAVIDPRNGKVLSEIDATSLVKEGKGNGDVLNGIAFKNENAYLTGKNWIKLFRVKFVKSGDV